MRKIIVERNKKRNTKKKQLKMRKIKNCKIF